MADDNPNVTAIEVKNICFLCQHGQIMGIEQETRGVHPLTQKPGTFAQQKFMVVCRAHGAFVFGPTISVLACTEFVQNDAGVKVLKHPREEDAIDDPSKAPVN